MIDTANRGDVMIEMVIVYCLVSDTKSCIEKRLRMENFSSSMGCTMSGQQRAQEYLRDHPNYMLKSWRCEVNVPRQALLFKPDYDQSIE
jgi:hypothetical protein